MVANSNTKKVVTANTADLRAFISANEGRAFNEIMKQVHSIMIEASIAQYGNNQTKIAEVLGVNRGTLRTRMINLGLIK